MQLGATALLLGAAVALLRVWRVSGPSCLVVSVCCMVVAAAADRLTSQLFCCCELAGLSSSSRKSVTASQRQSSYDLLLLSVGQGRGADREDSRESAARSLPLVAVLEISSLDSYLSPALGNPKYSI